MELKSFSKAMKRAFEPKKAEAKAAAPRAKTSSSSSSSSADSKSSGESTPVKTRSKLLNDARSTYQDVKDALGSKKKQEGESKRAELHRANVGQASLRKRLGVDNKTFAAMKAGEQPDNNVRHTAKVERMYDKIFSASGESKLLLSSAGIRAEMKEAGDAAQQKNAAAEGQHNPSLGADPNKQIREQVIIKVNKAIDASKRPNEEKAVAKTLAKTLVERQEYAPESGTIHLKRNTSEEDIAAKLRQDKKVGRYFDRKATAVGNATQHAGAKVARSAHQAQARVADAARTTRNAGASVAAGVAATVATATSVAANPVRLAGGIAVAFGKAVKAGAKEAQKELSKGASDAIGKSGELFAQVPVKAK